jgi:hypothetical protein
MLIKAEPLPALPLDTKTHTHAHRSDAAASVINSVVIMAILVLIATTETPRATPSPVQGAPKKMHYSLCTPHLQPPKW